MTSPTLNDIAEALMDLLDRCVNVVSDIPSLSSAIVEEAKGSARSDQEKETDCVVSETKKACR